MKDFKVLLIHANLTLDTLIPPNITILAAYLAREGFQVKLFDTTFYKTREFTGDDIRVETLQVKSTDFTELGIYLNKTDMVEDFVRTVQEYQPDLIGLSVVSPTYDIGLKLLRSISDFNIPKIVGGVHPTLCPEDTIKEDCVDMICVGEGEEALLELCNRMYRHEDITTIQNLWVKQDGKIYKNPIRPPVNMDDAPFQDWTIFDERRKYKPMGGKIRVTACVKLNRGCPFSCYYCTNEFFNKMYHSGYYRERSIEKVIGEMKHLKDTYNVEFFFMSAESFLNSKEKRFREFIEAYRELKIPFWMETRPESVTDEKIKLLEEVGCESINMGIENGDPRFRAEILNRKMTDEQIIRAFQTVRKYNIRCGANNIIGFPTETREHIFKTIELNRKANASNVMVHIFNPYNGTYLYDLCVKKGYIPEGAIGGDYRSDIILDMPQLTKEEIRGLHRTFAMYVKFPRDMWPEIEMAEKFDDKGNQKFEELSKIYREQFLR